MSDPADRFTGRAAAYAAARPTYPDEAIDFIFAGAGDPQGLAVADLGAGTGISARLLAARGARVFAVEPNAEMRARCAELPGITAVAASAEQTGLPARSVDLVTAFQAFHWFERSLVFAEIGRILRPRGCAAVVAYERDESDAATAAYGALVREFATDDTEARRTEALCAFADWDGWASVRRAEFHATHVLDEDGLVERVRSTSYLPQRGPRGEALLVRVRELFEACAREGLMAMHLLTTVALARPR